MNGATKTCRVCGKEYAACRSAKREAGVYRWQEVACSPECGARYLKAIQESRAPEQKLRKETRKRVVVEKAKDEVIVEEAAPEQAQEDTVQETAQDE